MLSGNWTLSGFARSRRESLRWYEVDFLPQPVHFRRGLPPLHESTCPQVWAQKVWGWSNVFSRRMGPKKVALNQVSAVPAGVLRVISYVILTYTSTFSNREPLPFSKAHALSYTHSKVGNDQMHIRGEMTSGMWTLSRFVRSRPESLWWFEVDFWPLRLHFRRESPNIFRKHMPWGMGTKSLGMIGCIFAEKGPLESGIESSFSGIGWGAMGEFRWIFDPNLCIFEGPSHHFPKAHALMY